MSPGIQLSPVDDSEMGSLIPLSVPVPTAWQPPEMHATPSRELDCDTDGSGVGASDQVVPSHVSASVRSPVPEPYSPTAEQVPVPAHETLERELDDEPAGAGVVCNVQLVPSQLSAKAAVVVAVEYEPTASQDPAPEHETPDNELDVASAGSGAVCTVHVDPFQTSARAWPLWLPTASQ
jgi:hypothetical protein